MTLPGAARLRVLGTRRRTRLLAALVLALAAVAVVVELGGDATGAEGERCASFAAASQARRAAPVDGTGQRLVVIGDSWAAGLGLDDPDRSWASRLDGRVHVDAFSGSGFSRHASPCSGSWFAARARRAVAGGADLVLVEGGLNDVDQSDAALRAGFGQVMRAVQGPPVVVIGPAAAPAREAGARRVDARLATLATQAGAAYVSTIGLDLDYLDDGLHLTLDGHRELGDFVARSLAELAR